MRVIAIEIHGGNDFTVRELDRSCDRLCWDEMLGTIGELTHPRIGNARYRMMTREERAAHAERFRPVQHPTYAVPPRLPAPSVQVPELELGADGTVRTVRPTMSREWVASTSEKYAHLAPMFAAAPLMLEALQRAVKAGIIDIDGEPESARAAIAKATGAA